MTKKLIGKVALITEASAGIGYACGRALATEGAHLVLTARRQDRLDAVKRENCRYHRVITTYRRTNLSVLLPFRPHRSLRSPARFTTFESSHRILFKLELLYDAVGKKALAFSWLFLCLKTAFDYES